jgi:hypothetical protein
MSSHRDLAYRAAMAVEVLLRRITALFAGVGAVRLITARLLVPGLLAMERFVNAYEETALDRARNPF